MDKTSVGSFAGCNFRSALSGANDEHKPGRDCALKKSLEGADGHQLRPVLCSAHTDDTDSLLENKQQVR